MRSRYVLSLILGLAVWTGLAYLSYRGHRLVQQAARHQRGEAFSVQTSLWRSRLQERLRVDETRAEATAALFAVSPGVSAEAFSTFTRASIGTGSHLGGVLFAARPGTRFHVLAPSPRTGRLDRLSAADPEAMRVQFGEPSTLPVRPGLDLAASSERAAALVALARGRRAAITAPHDLADLGYPGPGFLRLVPVRARSTSTEGRPDGVVAFVYPLDQFLPSLIQDTALPAGYRFELLDIGGGEETMLGVAGGPGAGDAEFVAAHDLRVDGRLWRLISEADPGFARRARWTSAGVLILGLVASTAVGALIFILSWRGTSLGRLLRAREREIEASREELIRTLDALREANVKLREAAQAKTDFLSIVSHELRTPLTVIQEFIDLLLEGNPDDTSETAREYLSISRLQLRRMNRLLGDLLDYARLEADALPIAPRFAQVESVLDRVQGLFTPMADGRNQKLECQFDGPLPALWIDPDRLEQILDNLVANALKFTPEGGTIRLRAGSVDGKVGFEVSDNGKGMSPAELARLFEPFYQGGSGRRSQVRGFGLGLAIARSLTRLQGGSIAVASDEGKGTTFTLRFSAPGVDDVVRRVRREMEGRSGKDPVWAVRAQLPAGADASALESWTQPWLAGDERHRIIRCDGPQPCLIVVSAGEERVRVEIMERSRAVFPLVSWTDLSAEEATAA